MKTKRIISSFLALVMLLGSMIVSVDAAWADKVDDSGNPLINYLNKAYASPEKKLADMDLVKEENGIQIYFEYFTGEIAFKNAKTGEITFSNPWDLNSGYRNIAPAIKQKLLSQLVITYLQNGEIKTMNSYTEAALRGQIVLKNIKNGVRVEYTLGEENIQRLVPRYIEKSRFEELITSQITEEWDLNKFTAQYTLYDKDDPNMTELAVLKMQAAYPVTTEMAIYVCDPEISAKDLRNLENYIKKWAPNYTYEEMQFDHEQTQYTASDAAPPRFRMAIEYKINEYGVEARLPANGIQFDESSFQLQDVTFLPYFGAASNEYTGYAVVPDGSGAIIRFEDFIGRGVTVGGNIYGQDYAYHTVTGQHTETMRMPYFGLMVNYDKEIAPDLGIDLSGDEDGNDWTGIPQDVLDKLLGKDKETDNDADKDADKDAYKDAETDKDGKPVETTAPETDKDGNPVESTAPETDKDGNPIETKPEETKKEFVLPENAAETEDHIKYSTGIFAIITEGDSLAALTAECGGSVHPYNTVYARFTPRPSDKYNLADSISVSGNTTWTVTSKRKYSDSYRIQYIFLGDDKLAEERGVKDYYSADYVGMAKAYRDYLIEKGELTKLTNTKEDIPLFIETFGSIETVERKFSFPVTVDTPLTTFDDIKTMYTELNEAGIGNLNFRLTGYANGGLKPTVPYKLSWTEVVGGGEGFKELSAYAEENGFELYPDFDFAYIHAEDAFDGINLKDHAVKTIDNRYTTRKTYNPLTQKFAPTDAIAISPSVYEYLYETFAPNYKAYGNDSISVSTLGTDLNSDFDEDDPYHREDSKQFTVKLLEKMNEDFSNIMVEGGNSFTLKYADVILGASLTSSNYINASQSIPFLGMVYHASKVYTGSPINMEGDMDTAILSAIENGAGMYFILSYQNSNRLKDDPTLREYYSVAYDIWKDDVIEYYNKLNDAISDLQTSYIVDHEFLEAERIADAAELEADKNAEQDILDKEAESESLAIAESERESRFESRLEEQYGIVPDSKKETETETEPEEEEITDESADEPESVEDETAEGETAEADDESAEGETTDEEEPETTEADESTDETAEGGVEYDEFGDIIENEEEVEEEEEVNKYATTTGSVVRVEYEGGVNFILNYNSFDIKVVYDGQTYEIGALQFKRLDK